MQVAKASGIKLGAFLRLAVPNSEQPAPEHLRRTAQSTLKRGLSCLLSEFNLPIETDAFGKPNALANLIDNKPATRKMRLPVEIWKRSVHMGTQGTAANPCRLVPVPGDPKCDFSSTPGKVTLTVRGTAGAVQFASVRVNGKDLLSAPAPQVDGTLVAGENKIDVVYVFSDPVNGTGELHEVCVGDTLLDTVQANNPAVRYVVCVGA